MNELIEAVRGINKILIVNLGGMGDFLLSLPALTAIKNRYPQSHITVLISDKALGLAKRMDFIDRIVILCPRSLWRMIFKGLGEVFFLRKEKFDLAVNMRSISSSLSALKIKALFAIINPKLSAGRNTQGRAAFFDIKIPEEDHGSIPERDYDLKLAEALGAGITDREVRFAVTGLDTKRVNELLKRAKIKDNDILIGLHPGGEYLRRWPLKNYRLLLRSLSLDQRLIFLVTGNLRERRLASRLIDGFGKIALNFAGELNLGELAALMRRCSLYITNDTGNMHLAAALKVPFLAVFGGAALKRFDPRILNPNGCLLYKKVACAPCIRKSCYSKICLKLITPEEVAKKVREILAKGEKSV